MTSELIECLEQDRQEFAFYAREHRAKVNNASMMTAEQVDATLAKAARNEDHVKRIDRVLSAHRAQSSQVTSADITALEKIQDYRFGSLVKGKNYAYARGLTINPAHLPAALDAMEADGFSLVCVFGQTNAEQVGFVFKRDPDKVNVAQLVLENERLQNRVDELLGANNAEVERRRQAESKLSQWKSGKPLDEIA